MQEKPWSCGSIPGPMKDVKEDGFQAMLVSVLLPQERGGLSSRELYPGSLMANLSHTDQAVALVLPG